MDGRQSGEVGRSKDGRESAWGRINVKLGVARGRKEG